MLTKVALSILLILSLASGATLEGFPAGADPAGVVEFDGALDLEGALVRARANRENLETALAKVSAETKPHLEWLITGMNDRDLTSLDTEFLVEHAEIALRSWREAPWSDAVPIDVFRESILPYASIDERRDRWRADFRSRFQALVATASSAGEAATILNGAIFQKVGVKYSTKRPKANQSPYESIDAGLASCTGLSILLIDACRSVGVPARFVGTPLWSDGSGNHSWVEVWDGEQWRFTGAAEPAGDDLDRAWFSGRAAKANRDDPRHAIYATTWRRTPTSFPMVWNPEDDSVSAVDVTDRYTRDAEALPPGSARVRFRVIHEVSGDRIAYPFEVRDGGGTVLFEGTTRDEGFDANDHVAAVLPLNQALSWHLLGTTPPLLQTFTVTDPELLVTRSLPESLLPTGHLARERLQARALEALEGFLESSPTDRQVDAHAWSRVPLTSDQVGLARGLLLADRSERLRHERRSEIEREEITIGDKTLRYSTTTFGKRPEKGWSLWISLHGGGGTTKAINDQQWENQKKLYTLEEGIYLAPRAPTDTWNLWHEAHIDVLFDRLIENCIHLEGVDPDRVFVLGYSAGGDGVYQLAPRMADRFAGAAMMAGHPNDARPEGLRNLPFTLHMGGDDAAYSRNAVAVKWKERLAELRELDPLGYEHWVEIHEGKGHWMDREDALAIPWLAPRTRNLRQKTIVWVQDDVTHSRSYWLAVPEPRRGVRIDATQNGQVIEVAASHSVQLSIRLDDTMLDLDQEVIVRQRGRVLFRGIVPRTISAVAKTLAERGDPRGVWSAEVTVDVPGPATSP